MSELISKVSINRSSIKSNILNNIIITFEYRGLNNLENSITKIIKGIENEFDSYDIIELQDTNIDVSEFSDRVNENFYKSNCFVIRTEDENEELIVNKYFIQYNIRCNKYKRFSHYRNILNTVISNLKEVTQLYKPIRLSHRKINSCIIKDVKKIYDYFEDKYYSSPYFNKEILNNTNNLGNFVSLESSNKIYKENFEFELITRAGLGEYKNNLAIRVIADIKGSVDSELLSKDIKYKDILDKINEELFNIFKEVLTEKFLNEMVSKNWDDTIIEGVNSNE